MKQEVTDHCGSGAVADASVGRTTTPKVPGVLNLT